MTHTKVRTSGNQNLGQDAASWIEALKSNDPVQRETTRRALKTAGHEVVAPLIRLLKEPHDHVCWEAAKALGEIGDPTAANALTETLHHENADVRWVAADALNSIGIDGLKPVLMSLLTKADSIRVRDGARHVVAHFASEPGRQFLNPLLASFDGFEPAVAIPLDALNALNELEEREAQLRRHGKNN